ncbi:mechanosensitive ion channel family protein [Acinetobacter sp. NIPH 1852]|uniref:mechanosensitive ion channel family protein n=1 Tax=Acinetobacter sp. NIPH 1852 TaxID=2923428 RepID=UPI001F4B8254|nr:mechanosensitive ion channel family protein [Acinetobacter sp. NIPH 1852]MCH7308108.1 mechanosensitive ion channel family protein [Acinetobacter sp. NIPH 1852]
MANEQKTITDVAHDTEEMIHRASEKTTQTMLGYTEKYQDTYTAIDKMVLVFWERLPYIGLAIIAFILFWLLTKLFKLFVDKTLSNRSYARQNLVLVLHRVGTTFILFLGFLIALVIAIPGFTPGQLVGALGIGSVAIGFAFKDIFQNLLSGILILLGEPFKIGDAIIVSGMEGTVEDIQIRATFLRSYDGRRIVIPNATVYTSPVTVNTAYQQRRCEFVVGIGYDDDEQKAKQIVLDILNNERTVLSHPTFSVNVTALADFSVNLTVRWWINTTETDILSSSSMIQAQVKQAFSAQGINIPYPIQEFKVQSNQIAQLPTNIKPSDNQTT